MEQFNRAKEAIDKSTAEEMKARFEADKELYMPTMNRHERRKAAKLARKNRNSDANLIKI